MASATGTKLHSGQRLYSDEATVALLMLKAMFRLAYRQTEGFAFSLFRVMVLKLEAPDYSTLCYHSGSLHVPIQLKKRADTRYIVIDSTGLKVYGEGEWTQRKHSKKKRRA